jgi:glycosyltransferase involved in cell wall biosynthesis
MDISIVLCTHNRASSLRKTLDTLGQMSVPPDLRWELLVVDSDSSDDTRQAVNEFTERTGLDVRYVWEPQRGKSLALNTGIKKAKGGIIAFTDDDVRVAPEWLHELVRTFREFDCMGVGGRSVPAWGGLIRPDWLITEGPYHLVPSPILDFDQGDEAKELQIAPWGLNMAFRRSAFDKYGLFRTDLGPCGTGRILGEDIEFGGRLLRCGEKIIYSPTAVVFHPVEQQRITKNYFLQYYFNSLGRAHIRQERWPANAVLYFGVPRYIFRRFLTNCVSWFFAFDKKRRFYYKTRLYSVLGQIAEARNLQRDRHTTG